jgi:hypothetical protein
MPPYRRFPIIEAISGGGAKICFHRKSFLIYPEGNLGILGFLSTFLYLKEKWQKSKK